MARQLVHDDAVVSGRKRPEAAGRAGSAQAGLALRLRPRRRPGRRLQLAPPHWPAPPGRPRAPPPGAPPAGRVSPERGGRSASVPAASPG